MCRICENEFEMQEKTMWTVRPNKHNDNREKFMTIFIQSFS